MTIDGDDKWISGVQPDEPATAIASTAIKQRLKSVWYYAPRAAKRAAEDEEYVHQLRVSTRRAKAAVAVFAQTVPARRARSVKRRLRGFRNAAGVARDLDMLAERIASAAGEDHRDALTSVLARIAKERRQAQKPLLEYYRESKHADFLSECKQLVRRVRWRGEGTEPNFVEFSRPELRRLVEDFLQAQQASGRDTEALHQLRIAGKQLRYAIELVAGAFGPSLRKQLYPELVRIQTRLGEINDLASGSVTLKNWAERADGSEAKHTLLAISEQQRRRMKRKVDRFRHQWDEDQATELGRQFMETINASNERP